MALNVQEMGPRTVRLALDGRLDAVGVGRVELPFTAQASAGNRHVVVDLTGVEFIASLGLRMLIAAAQVVQRRDRVLVLFGARPPVAEVLETVALDRLIPVRATEAEALACLPA